MKTIRFFIFAACAAVIGLLSSCEKEMPYPYNNPVRSYAVDMSKAVSGNFFTLESAGGKVDLGINLPFASKVVLNERFYSHASNSDRMANLRDSMSVNGNIVTIEKARKYTRDFSLLVTSSVTFLLKEADGLFFRYPVTIRQYGELTNYLTEDDVRTFNSDGDYVAKGRMKERVDAQQYLLGTVRSVSAVGVYEGIRFENAKRKRGPGHPNGEDGWYDPLVFDTSWGTPLNLQYFDLEVGVGGEVMKVRVQYPVSYGLVGSLASEITAGCTVEIGVNGSGIRGLNTDYILYATPSDVLVK